MTKSLHLPSPLNPRVVALQMMTLIGGAGAMVPGAQHTTAAIMWALRFAPTPEP